MASEDRHPLPSGALTQDQWFTQAVALCDRWVDQARVVHSDATEELRTAQEDCEHSWEAATARGISYPLLEGDLDCERARARRIGARSSLEAAEAALSERLFWKIETLRVQEEYRVAPRALLIAKSRADTAHAARLAQPTEVRIEAFERARLSRLQAQDRVDELWRDLGRLRTRVCVPGAF